MAGTFSELRQQGLAKAACFTKAASSGVALSPSDLEAINGFALSPLSSESIYSRKVLLAHNAVDRDRERFQESLLDDFASTLPGKSFLWAHNRRDYTPYGLWFKAETEEITRERFVELTGEDPRLPEGTSTVKVLWAWFYVVKNGNGPLIENVEAGILRHFSIGFDAKDLVPVRGKFDEVLFWEYLGPGEALEGSLVWLGAQNGATAQKAYKDKFINDHNDHNDHSGTKENTMKDFLKKLGVALGKTFSDSADTAVTEIQTLITEKGAEIDRLTKRNEELSADAELGKKYKGKLTDDFTRLKGVLGEREDTPEAATSMKRYAEGMPVDFLETEIKHLEKRVTEKHPDGQVKTSDEDKRTGGENDNPLIPKAEK
jgi:hypothetical protein